MPFVFKNVEHGRATFDGPVGDEFAELLRTKDVHVIAWLEHGLRQLTANRPIRTPADLSGIKLRVPQGSIAAECFRMLGADIRTMPFQQVYEALRGQIIEAQENPIATVEFDKFYEVQKYLCLTGHIYSAGMMVVSADVLGDLTERQRAALRQCGGLATRRSREVAGQADREGLVWLRERGMVVIDNVDRSAFAAGCRPVIDMLSQRFGADRVARLTRAAG
jgi:TRAP-type C4-dicarboxylate transport system substrate-binding protein